MVAAMTASKVRWTAHGLLAVLSVATVARGIHWRATNDVPQWMGDWLPQIAFGATGLIGAILCRTVYLLVKRPWRLYIDRAEFAFLSLLCILWTSMLMSYSAFAVAITLCRVVAKPIADLKLPSCGNLALDITLYYTLSASCLVGMLSVLSEALSPSYAATLSILPSDEAQGLASDTQRSNMFVMWDLAVGRTFEGATSNDQADDLVDVPIGYGSTVSAAPQKATGTTESLSNPYATRSGHSQDATVEEVDAQERAAPGLSGVGPLYGSLLASSVGVTISALWALDLHAFASGTMFVVAVSLSSALFAGTRLFLHRRDDHGVETFNKTAPVHQRHARAVEVGFALALLVIWPFVAMIYTIFPSSPDGRCHPASSSAAPEYPAPDEGVWLRSPTVCELTGAVIGLSWISTALIGTRLLSLMFDSLQSSRTWSAIPPTPTALFDDGGEPGESVGLLAASRSGGARLSRAAAPSVTTSDPSSSRPQVKWGRMIAGEAFELGSDDEGA